MGKELKVFLKYGLTYIATLLLNSEFQSDIDIFKFFVMYLEFNVVLCFMFVSRNCSINLLFKSSVF